MIDYRTVSCDGRAIKWILRRKRVKNLNLRVKPDGFVYVSANSHVTISTIENFIKEKSDFIFAALDKFSAQGNAPTLPEAEKTYQSGDTVCYFGQNYTLSIDISDKESIYLNDGEFAVNVKSADRTGKLLRKFYDRETKKLFDSMNKRTYEMFRAKGYNVPKAELQVREMRSRWGSCHLSKGKITMNSRLALYPEMCAAYVFVHEYAHFIVPSHSKDFYAVVKSIMPDYEVCVNILKG